MKKRIRQRTKDPRLAETVEERNNPEAMRLRSRVFQSRVAQGLPPTVEDEATLRRVATLIQGGK